MGIVLHRESGGLVDFLQQEVAAFAMMGHDELLKRYVVANGRSPRDEALTPEEWAVVERITRAYRFPIKQCFANTQRALVNYMWLLSKTDETFVVIDGHQLAYVEGFVLDPRLFPIHHSWLEINGKVLDLTLRRKRKRKRTVLQDRVVGTLDGMQYFGVPFSPKALRERIVATKMFGSMLDDWERGHPVLMAWRDANPAVLQAVTG